MKKCVLTAFAVLLAACSCAAAAEQLRVGMECAFAPNNWQESAATESNYPVENVPGAFAEGYDVQISKMIAKDLGRELVIIKLAWEGLIEALNQGQIDAIIAGMTGTPEGSVKFIASLRSGVPVMPAMLSLIHI